MSGFLPQLVLLAAGGSIAAPNAAALALGYFTTCAAMGFLGLTIFEETAGAEDATSMVGRAFITSVGGLLIGLYAAMPRRASTMPGSLRAWMEKSCHAITVVVCSMIEAYFLMRGPAGL